MLLFNLKLQKKLYCIIFCLSIFQGAFSADRFAVSVFTDGQEPSHEKEIESYFSLPFLKKQTVHLLAQDQSAILLNFDEITEENSLVEYKVDGVLVGTLTITDSLMVFRAEGQQHRNFIVTTAVKKNLVHVESQADFTFQKPLECQIGVIGCKKLVLADTFYGQEKVVIKSHDCIVHSDLKSAYFTFQGAFFRLTRQAHLDIGEVGDFFGLQHFINQGKAYLGKSAGIAAVSLENYGDLQATIFNVKVASFRNNGVCKALDSFLGRCDVIKNYGQWLIHNDCVLQDVKELQTSHDSIFRCGHNFTGAIDRLFLEGKSEVGNLAFLRVGSYARLGRSFSSYVFDLQSQGMIETTPGARFCVKHYFGLKSAGWLSCDSNVIMRHFKDKVKSLPLDENPLDKEYPKFVVIESIGGNVRKSGDIYAPGADVSITAEGFLRDSGKTDTGSDPQKKIFMSAESIVFEKKAILSSSLVFLIAKKSIEQNGNTYIEKQFDMKAPEISHGGTSTVEDILSVESDNFLLHHESSISSKNSLIKAQNSIEFAGDISGDSLIARSKSMKQSGCFKIESIDIDTHISSPKLTFE